MRLNDKQAIKCAAYATKRARIYYCELVGLTMGDTHRQLGIIYQHVYNELHRACKSPKEVPTFDKKLGY